MQRDRIEELFYGRPDQQRRFTQDFPILPDVWIAYGRSPADRIELLLSPHNESDAARVAAALRQRLEHDRAAAGGRWQAAHPGMRPPRVLFNESVVLAGLSFWELLRDALPLTDWWKRAIGPLGDDWSRSHLTELAARLNDSRTGGAPVAIGTDPRLLVKLIRIAACIEGERQGRPIPEVPVDEPALTPAGDRPVRRVLRRPAATGCGRPPVSCGAQASIGRRAPACGGRASR